MFFAFEVLGKSGIMHRNEEVFFWRGGGSAGSTCNSALMEVHCILVWLTVQNDITESTKRPVLPKLLFV